LRSEEGRLKAFLEAELLRPGDRVTPEILNEARRVLGLPVRGVSGKVLKTQTEVSDPFFRRRK